MQKALFLDRDGVINIDKSYLYKIEEFEFCDGIFELLNHAVKLGYLLFVVTNQSGIGRGYYSEADFLKLTDWMVKEFEKREIPIQKVYYCPHHPNQKCNCRKPEAGMFLQAKREFDIDMKSSWMIGDKESDMTAAKKADIPNTVCINNNCKNAKYRVNSLFDIIDLIKK